MSKKTEYKITEEICELFSESQDAKLCMESAVGSVWGTRRAIAFARKTREKTTSAWELVYELYPELIGKNITFRPREKDVIIDLP